MKSLWRGKHPAIKGPRPPEHYAGHSIRPTQILNAILGSRIVVGSCQGSLLHTRFGMPPPLETRLNSGDELPSEPRLQFQRTSQKQQEHRFQGNPHRINAVLWRIRESLQHAPRGREVSHFTFEASLY